MPVANMLLERALNETATFRHVEDIKDIKMGLEDIQSSEQWPFTPHNAVPLIAAKETFFKKFLKKVLRSTKI